MKERLRVGFTGTRRGMTEQQKIAVRNYLWQYRGVFRHGDCKGADAEAQYIARDAGYYIVAHPCNLDRQRANTEADFEHAPQPPLARNCEIVDNSDVLIACPGEKDERLRSGTWATVRYARRVGVPVMLFTPEGSPPHMEAKK